MPPSFPRAVVVTWLLFLSSAAHGVTLKNDHWAVDVDPQTLRTTATVANDTLPIASPSPARQIADLQTDALTAHWRYPTEKLTVSMKLDGDTVIAHFTADAPGSFAWPTLSAADAPPAYLLPMFEGLRVPTDDEPWATFLEHESPLDTTAGLSMPFWGVQRLGHTLTYLLPDEFNNELTFHRDHDRLALSFAHAFTRNHPVKEYDVRVTLASSSEVEPAKVYRRWLIDQGRLVTMTQKIARTPAAARLPGAAHVYLWGDGLITRGDFKDAAELCRRILSSHDTGVGQRLWSLLDDEGHKLLTELAAKHPADNYDRGRLAETLSTLLERKDFYTPDAWAALTIPDEATTLLKLDAPTPGQIGRRNSLLLHAAYADLLKPVDAWGDGFSTTMLQRLADAGLDRLWLGSPNWKGLSLHPAFTRDAIARGYLVGPYDSYHSIHSPSEKDTWETAQFDQSLYDTGGIVRADGTKKKGFKQKGYNLSPIAVRPYVERRVRELMAQFQCNSWFIDCDAFGEVFDDYSPDHPATQAEDCTARLSRLAWIRDTFHAVIGSEGGSSYAAGTIHFAHGIMTPVIGWGDPALTDRKSPYFLGRYWPPDAPEMSFKQVPMKPEYRRVYADPRFRLPLYQVALHDSIVTTHEWGEGSLKFTDPDHARELLELLYDVPPLYHLNLAEWTKRQALIVPHYQFFSHLHREAALWPMTDWQCLTPDRLVQRTTFADGKLRMIANFGEKPCTYEGHDVPAQSVLAAWADGRPSITYSPHQ